MSALDQVKAIGRLASSENNLPTFEVCGCRRLREQLDVVRRHALEKWMRRQPFLHLLVSRVHIDLSRCHTHESRLNGQAFISFAHDMIDNCFDLMRSFPHGQLPIRARALTKNFLNVR